MTGEPLFLDVFAARERARALVVEAEQLLGLGLVHGRLSEIVAEIRWLSSRFQSSLWDPPGSRWADRADCAIQAWKESQ